MNRPTYDIVAIGSQEQTVFSTLKFHIVEWIFSGIAADTKRNLVFALG